MLSVYPQPGRTAGGGFSSDELAGAVWIDLLDPSAEEVRRAEAVIGIALPNLEQISEIEVSSRLARRGVGLVMTAPLVAAGADGAFLTSPTAFILTPERLATIRYHPTAPFERAAAQAGAGLSAASAFVSLLDEIVDHAADRLEAIAAELDGASAELFRSEGAGSRPTRDTRRIRALMAAIGLASERMSKARYALTTLSRIAQFASERGGDAAPPEARERLAAVRADVASLEQFEDNLLSRVQLLQDAASAFISIEQNEVVKVLTVASVAGIPPVLVVGVYGMNFKVMPELGWSFGYPYALVLVVLTTLVPIAWFKWKDWI